LLFAPMSRLGRVRLGLLANALRWRAGSSAVFFVVALLAVAAATAGPVYLAAADQSVLSHVVVPPPPVSTGLIVNEQPGQPVSEASFEHALAFPSRSPSGQAFFAKPIFTAVAGVGILSASGGELAVADVVSRSGDCLHLSFVRGRCPRGPGEVAMSTRSAAYLHIRVGSGLKLSIGASVRSVEVRGLYRAGPSSAPYWWGSDYFEFGTSQTPPPRMDALFADFSIFTLLPPHQVALGADVPVNTRSLHSTEVPAFRHLLAEEELHLGRLGLLAASGIGGYLDEAATQQRSMTTTIAVIDLQLLLLVLMVLFGIAGRTAAERDQDLALANLRGLSPRSIWAVALREPFVLIVAATPVGAALGWLLALATARANLLAGTPVPFDSLALGAALAASLAALVATAGGSRRVLSPATRVSGAARSRLAVAMELFAEAFVVALAIAAVVQVSASGVGTKASSQPLAAAAPGLVALAAGVIAARVVPTACRLAAAAWRFSPRVGLSLALQRVARQSGVIRQSVIIAIAVALGCFSVAGVSIDRANRSEEALFLVGSNRVLTVSVPATVDFEQAVHEADPSGREAMAAEVTSNSEGTLLAVDTSSFADVASWPNQPGAARPGEVARYLTPPVAPAVTLEGGELRVVIDLRAAVRPGASLTFGLFNEQYGAAESVTVGPLQLGRHVYYTSLVGYCVSVCRLQSVTADWAGTGAVTVPVEIEQLAVDDGAKFAPVAAGLSAPRHWRVAQVASGEPSSLGASPSGLSVSFRYVAGQSPPVIAPADVPALLPAVVTNVVASISQSGPTGSTDYSILNLDGSSLSVNGAMQVPAIPAVGTNAVLVNLTDALRDESLPDIYSSKQVWLSATAGSGARIVERLRREGIDVLSVRTAASMEAAFKQDGPTLAFGLFLVVGAESALLAAGSLLFAIAADTRKRAIEAVALRAVGLSRRHLVQAMAGELGIVCATGLGAGALAGLAAAHFSLPSVPEFTGLPPGPTLAFGLPYAWLAAFVAGAALLLGLAVAIAIAVVGAASTPDKLRISQR
jgi:hypothetical protein